LIHISCLVRLSQKEKTMHSPHLRSLRWLASIALVLTLGACATRPSNLAGVEVQSVQEIVMCDEANGSAGFLGGAVGQALGHSVDKSSGSALGGLLGYYVGLKIGCETSKRPGQILTVRDSAGQVSQIQNDARRNGMFKEGDRVTYEAESRWADVSADRPWIKKVQP
jgi:outer membrane lipoprotein SlyB